jgi:hypothetical protein
LIALTPLQDMQGLGHARTPHAEHQCQEFVGERHADGAQAIGCHEHPPGEALIQPEASIGVGGLGHLKQEIVHVAQQVQFGSTMASRSCSETGSR